MSAGTAPAGAVARLDQSSDSRAESWSRGGSEPRYVDGLTRLLTSYRAIPVDQRVRLAKRTSNLFRARRRTDGPGLDVSGLTGVLAVDPVARTADVGGMCTYEDLVAATLPHGLAPLVVPQLKTITVGGAATGGGIESTAFRSGVVYDDIVVMDILTGSGEVLTAAPDGPHADLFHGFANSYGSLGYATRLRVRLEPVQPYVALRHLRFHDVTDLQAAIAQIGERREHSGEPVDYLDGVVFTADEQYLTLGRLTGDPGPTSDYRGRQIYYRSIQERSTDRLTIHDYLWRWDTDWFWCSRAFGAQQPLIRRMWPPALKRSSVYWKLVALDRRFGIADGLERLHGRPPLERVVQDVEVPVERTAEFLTWFLGNVPIEPIWVCPLRIPRRRDAAPGSTDPTWPLHPFAPERTYVNVGFWSVVPKRPGAPEGATNRRIEALVGDLGGHKALYSDAFYSREEFAAKYGGATYAALKSMYDPTHRLIDLYDKAVRRQ
ncbi:MAG TPA: FAD-binding oxidoreductase [Nakamurella sp.]